MCFIPAPLIDMLVLQFARTLTRIIPNDQILLSISLFYLIISNVLAAKIGINSQE